MCFSGDKDFKQIINDVNDVEAWIEILTQPVEYEIANECYCDMSSMRLTAEVEAPTFGPAVLTLRAASSLRDGLLRSHELVDIEIRSEVDLHFAETLSSAVKLLKKHTRGTAAHSSDMGRSS